MPLARPFWGGSHLAAPAGGRLCVGALGGLFLVRPLLGGRPWAAGHRPWAAAFRRQTRTAAIRWPPKGGPALCDPLWAAALGRPPKGDRPRAAAFGGPSEGDRPCAAALGRSLVGGRVLALARGRAPPSGLPDMGAPLTLQMECQMMMVCGSDKLGFPLRGWKQKMHVTRSAG